jgi:hypothetical protein
MSNVKVQSTKIIQNLKHQYPSKEPRLRGEALKPKFSKPKTEIPKQVRDDKNECQTHKDAIHLQF